MSAAFEVVRPTVADRRSAIETKRRLRSRTASPVGFEICVTGGEGEGVERVPIPEAAYAVLVNVIEQFAKGNAVSVSSIGSELTTGQAAKILNVSRPYVVQMLEKGEIPYRKVGTKRRLGLEDVLTYKLRSKARRAAAMQRLADFAAEQDEGL